MACPVDRTDIGDRGHVVERGTADYEEVGVRAGAQDTLASGPAHRFSGLGGRGPQDVTGRQPRLGERGQRVRVDAVGLAGGDTGVGSGNAPDTRDDDLGHGTTNFASAGGSPTKIIPVPGVQPAATRVAGGLGVSVMSDEMAAHRPDVDRIPVAEGWPELPLGLVWRKDGT